ncbi:MAG: hypothetical protein WC819_06740, partial [Parcubacteria group bacterium]
MKKKKILSLTILIQITLLLIEPFVAQASIFGSANVSSQARSGINDFLEQNLNINVEESLKPITESINAMDRKGTIPEVSIRFSTTNPQPGEIITASADVKGLSNTNDAYYMWYLSGPSRTGDEATAQAFGLAPGGIGDPPMQNIFAIQAQAALYFDPLTLDQKMNGGNEDGKYIDEYMRITTDDNDGYKAPLGGANAENDGGNDYCYIYDPESGMQYELMLDDGEDMETGDGCDAYDTDTTDYVARCMISDSANMCPTIIPHLDGIISMTVDDGDISSDISMSGGDGARMRGLARCLDYGVDPMCSDGKLSCPSADGATITDYDVGALTAVIPTPHCIPKDRATGQLWKDPNLSGCPAPKSVWCFDGEGWPADPTGYEDLCGTVYGEERGNYYGNSCHDWYLKGDFFEPGECKGGELDHNEDNTCPALKSHAEGGIRPFPEGAGDGDFPLGEELVYHLNPFSDRTTPLAENDEALTMGVGQVDFTWRYQEGDKIGVIVEGIGLGATKHEDASYQTVYAMLQPGCKDVIEPIGSYNETIKNKSINIKTASVNLGKCIEGVESGVPLYVKPGTSEYDSLTVSLSTGASQSGAAIPSGLGQPVHVTASANE